jgi:hypothetical protein
MTSDIRAAGARRSKFGVAVVAFCGAVAFGFFAYLLDLLPGTGEATAANEYHRTIAG